MKRIYLDNAATSWPKPEAVYEAVDQYLRHSGAPAGRSTYAQATSVNQTISAARAAVARLIGAPHARHVIFTGNGTQALNLAIHGLLRPGDHAVCTDADHNSVLRPMHFLQERRGVEVSCVSCGGSGLIDPEDVRRALRPNTRLVAMLHASNVTGALQPVAEVARIVQAHGAKYLVDAAQSLGHLPISVDDLGADLLAAPAHKGLLGPLGVGVLYVRPGLENELDPAIQGGTGSFSQDDRQPEALPDRFEAGNHNVVGLVGLAAALHWLETKGISAIHTHEQTLLKRLREGLAALSGVTVHGAAPLEQSVGVLSLSIEGYDPQEAATLLDCEFGVQVRAGLHCAPRMHRALGTLERGGLVRFSLGPFTTSDDIDAALQAVAKISGAS